jgi:hypothetical protein
MIPTQTIKPDIRRSRPSTVTAPTSLAGLDVLTPPRRDAGSQRVAHGKRRKGRCLPTPMSRGLAALSLATAGLGLAACSAHGARPSPLSTPSTSHPTTSATSASAAPTHPAPSSADTQPPSSGAASAPSTTVAGCRTSALQLTQVDIGGAAGSKYVTYYLQNRGPAACTLTGFPGFALLDAHGAIIQRPAERTDAHYSTVTLHPDDRVQFIVRTSNPSIPGTGCSAAWRTAQVQVYPPNETSPLRQPSTLQACDLTVGPVQSVVDVAHQPRQLFGTAPVSGRGNAVNAFVTGLRADRHPGYDRLVFDLEGAGLPMFGARYPGSGSSIQVGLCGLGSATSSPHGSYGGPRYVAIGLPELRSVTFTGSGAGCVGFLVATAHRHGFRVITLLMPSRVVLDVAY